MSGLPEVSHHSISAALTAAKEKIARATPTQQGSANLSTLRPTTATSVARANPAQGGNASGTEPTATPNPTDSTAHGDATDAPRPPVAIRARALGAPRQPLPDDPIPLLMRMASHYGWDGPIPESVIAALGLDLPPIDCVRRAIDRMFMFLLGKWARGDIPGPDTFDNLQEQAKQAEKLARMFDKKGKPAEAEKQRARAEELRQKRPVQSEDWFAKVRAQ